MGNALEMVSALEIDLHNESGKVYDSEDDFDDDFQRPFLQPRTFVPPASRERHGQKEVLVIKTILLLLISGFLALAGWMNNRETHVPLAANKCSANTGFYTRKEWRELSSQDQLSYLDAIKCMTKIPSKLDLNTSRLDDFTYSHIHLVDQTHFVAVAMPWHRYFIWIWEQTLRQECGYQGYLPYWDWMIDPKNTTMTLSSIWDPSQGFGGNGSASNRCVTGGPLENILLNYTWDGYGPHCLTRNLTETTAFSGGESDAVRDIVDSAKSYDEFRERLERGPHKHIHVGINGEMLTSFSTNDPLFFLHHAQLDRIWSIWESRQPAERRLEYGGKTYLAQEASVKDMVSTFGLRDDIPVRDLLDTQDGPFCYNYSSVF